MIMLISAKAIKMNDICTQPISSGFCRVFSIKYYYDSTSSSCKQFVYGGCGGMYKSLKSFI